MRKIDLQSKFPLTSYSEEEVRGSRIASFSFRWTVPPAFIDLRDYPSLAIGMARSQRIPQVLVEAKAQVVSDGVIILNAMEIFFDLRPVAKALDVEIGGTGRAGFSAECNYVSFLAGLVSSMDAVVAQCRSGPKSRGKNLSEAEVGKEIGKLARDFASAGEFEDMKEAKARFLILALDNFPS